MNYKNLIRTIGLITAGACWGPAARAGMVKYTIGDGGLDNFDIKMDGSSTDGILAGGISISQDPSGNNPSLPENYVTVCTDIEGSLYLGNTYKYMTPVTSFSGQSGVDPTWGAVNTPTYLGANAAELANAQQAIQNAAYIFYKYGQLTSGGIGGSTVQKAALQLAVWEALYDTTAGGSVSLGSSARFQVSDYIAGDTDESDAITEAATMVSGLDGNYNINGYLLFPLGAPGDTQANPDGQPPQELLIAAVPEPATAFAGLLLLLPFGAGAIRRMRKVKS